MARRLHAACWSRVGLLLLLVSLAAATSLSAQVTPIATIQANPSAYQDQTVTVEGQVYVPTNYRGTVFSGYIQDSSGRGINLFGNTANNSLLFDVGNIVRVTGTVDVYFTTVEIVPTSVTLVSGGNPPLQPEILSTAAAASSAWEGTFIESSGTITARQVGGPGTNYTINDGSGPLVIRVVDALGAPQFSVGQTITGRGAGGEFSGTFQILVGRAQDVFEGSGGDPTPPTLTGARANSATEVVVEFSETVTVATAQVVSNYEIYETANAGNTIAVSGATLSGSGMAVTLSLGASLPSGVQHTVRVNNVEDEAGNPIAANSTRTFTYSSVQITPIATIQANPSAYQDQTVTVEGQVYVPANHRGTVFSGYIQDGSGRGINLFGNTANNSLLFDVGNIVRVTGTVDVYFSTVEIVPTNVTLVSGGNPPLQPEVLSTAAAASSAWEGTFIESSGTITARDVAGPGTNYTINDGSGPLVIRVVDALGASQFSVGQTITGRGAGAEFSGTFQILVGRAQDVFEGSGEDTTPPTIASVAAQSATQVTVGFSEAVTFATAETTSNYEIYETAQTSNTVPITGASLSPGSAMNVTLALGASLQSNLGYTVRVNNVEDIAGNPIAANSTRTFTYGSVQVTPIATIQANPSAYQDQTVTVEGQVYVPANYRGTVFSGYIQDSSDRGINVFGNTANNPLLFDVGNIVRVTGTVDVYFSTVEIVPTSVILVSGGNPPLQPEVLSTGAAANSAWEGTFIESSGTITASAVAGPGTNYTINDGSGPLLIRVVDALGAPQFSVGQTITGRGAGAEFSGAFQILVGRAADVSGSAPPSGAGTLSLSGPPHTFLPTLGETYPIRVFVPPTMAAGAEILLRIFDLQGRLRRTLADNRFGPILPTVRWNGRDDATELVPAGTYIVHLVVVDGTTGNRETKQMPVVVASRLNR